ncbi:MAG: hypothetical protein H8E31_10485 [Planctomycetes bacterium]|nr:hypothetical protein [Planctomycetota bacterium]
MLNPDYSDMLSALSGAAVEYLLVGAYAMACHGLPRATGDIDLWVKPSRENALRVFRALDAFGAPRQDLTQSDLERPGTVFQIGVAPRRIDLLTAIAGVAFEEAWSGRMTVEIAGLVVPVLGRDQLLKNKEAAGRPKDLADLEELRRLDT